MAVQTKDCAHYKSQRRFLENNMRKGFYTLIFLLAFATAYSVSQITSSSGDVDKPQATTPSQSAPDAQNPSSSQTSSQSNTTSNTTSSTTTSNPAVDDSTLHSQLHDKFASDSALSNVSIDVKNAKVTLTGNVASNDDKKRAKQLAESVPGVNKVKNALKVSCTGSTSGADS